MTEFSSEFIAEQRKSLIERENFYAWDNCISLEALDHIERHAQRIAELEEALTKIASYESMRFKLSPYEYGLLEQIIGIAEHALKDGE